MAEQGVNGQGQRLLSSIQDAVTAPGGPSAVAVETGLDVCMLVGRPVLRTEAIQHVTSLMREMSCFLLPSAPDAADADRRIRDGSPEARSGLPDGATGVAAGPDQDGCDAMPWLAGWGLLDEGIPCWNDRQRSDGTAGWRLLQHNGTSCPLQ